MARVVYETHRFRSVKPRRKRRYLLQYTWPYDNQWADSNDTYRFRWVAEWEADSRARWGTLQYRVIDLEAKDED